MSMPFQQSKLASGVAALLLGILTTGPLIASAQSVPILDKAVTAQSSIPVKGQISVARGVKIAPEKETVSMNLREADIRDVLNSLAKQGNFNIILDESVKGTLTIDVNSIPINKALEYIFTVSGFTYTKDGNTLIVADSDAAEEKNLVAQTFKSIPVLYKSAGDIAAQLNKTLFSAARPGGAKNAVTSFDPESNSLLIMGTDADIRLAADALRELDVPRNRKVYHIRHNTPDYVAQVIAANFFTPAGGGVAGGGGAGGGAAGGAGGGAAGGAGGGAAGGAGGAGGGAATAKGGPTGTQGMTNITQAGGVMMVSESISSTLTVMGTEEQIALVDSIIDQVDRRRPQVALEMSIVEMTASDLKQFAPTFGNVTSGNFTLGLVSGTTATSSLSWTRNAGSASGRTLPFESFSLVQRFNSNRVKVLANPTIVALDGQQSTFNVTDQIATINETVVTSGGASTTTATITASPVGISATVTPTIYDDGSVVLNLNPINISRPGETVTAGAGSATQTTLTSTRNLQINAVRVQDGQTLVIGGILNNQEITTERKVPILSDIPVVGGLFKTSGTTTLPNTYNKTELVIFVTPHIIKDDSVSYFENPPQAQNHYNSPNQGAVQPVSLPRFIGTPPTDLDPGKSSNNTTDGLKEHEKEKAVFLPWRNKKKDVPTPEEANLKPIETTESSLSMPAVAEPTKKSKRKH